MPEPDARDYEIRIWYSAEAGDDCFVAQVVECPGIMAHGDTREEAARQIQLALEGALEIAAEQGVTPPSPALETAAEVITGLDTAFKLTAGGNTAATLLRRAARRVADAITDVTTFGMIPQS
jgi:predicted RNase H-like HicB family nuclease